MEAPLAELAAKTEAAHRAGAVTEDFNATVQGMHEVGRIIATLPAPEIRVSPEDRIAPITSKKRFIVRVTGFLKKAADQVDERSVSLTADGLAIAEVLRRVLEAFGHFIK